MNKVCGKIECFVPVRNEGTRVVYSFFPTPVGNDLAEWYEQMYYKKQVPSPTLEQLKADVIAGVDALTDEKILSGFVWEGKPVWLSQEKQFNFKAAYDLAVQTSGMSLPVKFKLGETADGEPVYHTFGTLEEIQSFYLDAIRYIQQCLNEGWEKKDGIDWSKYQLT